MKMSPQDQMSLLALSDVQAKIDSINARQRILPERAKLDQLLAERATQRTSSAKSKLNVSDIELELRRLESDLSKLKRREAADRASLGAAEDKHTRRDLQHDLEATSRRRAALEHEIEQARHMRAAQAANSRFYSDDLDERIRYAEEDLYRAQSQLDEEKKVAEAVQETRREALSPELLSFYDKLAINIATPVARIEGRACGSCFIELDVGTKEYFENLPADVVCFCIECGAMLVRPKTIAAARA